MNVAAGRGFNSNTEKEVISATNLIIIENETLELQRLTMHSHQKMAIIVVCTVTDYQSIYIKIKIKQAILLNIITSFCRIDT